MTSTPPAPAAPLGIRPFYTQHTEPLDVEVTAKVMTCSGLDLTLAEAGTGRPMFAVVGKLAFLGNVAEVRAADGALLYRIWQKRAALRNKYKATQGSKPKTKAEEQADVLFHAEGGYKLSFDLDVTYRSFDEGKEQTLTLKTGVVSSCRPCDDELPSSHEDHLRRQTKSHRSSSPTEPSSHASHGVRRTCGGGPVSQLSSAAEAGKRD